MSDGYYVDMDTTDDFLDKPPLIYEPDGHPLFTPEELERLGSLTPKEKRLKVPNSRDVTGPRPGSSMQRTFQVRLDGMGVALYEGVDGADALRQYFVDTARGEPTGSLTITESSIDYVTGRMNDEYFVEAEAVHPLDPGAQGRA
jgi:hypothetical protein